ncbi:MULTISPECIES: glycosyltransferase family 4 protein [Acidobacterium]|uniref:Glycosyl transferase, group 1 family n=1 Tax=Acidobacterium capsulatum (strain ATCC 51196 / DSM 11244 / BCRC 80197 / JCM 7670 / NBRC 15755 / NCIMB 13165 / 161) TaxID=240015 RepID=C1F0W7_ACIC5|nr:MULTISPECIES: glycosyltransferase family 4 protein [Acidobacterium]ACO31358.1 glycosyl transferase, group 1 family [Acidobacterium capsulatum ATCC 51196]
MATTESSLRVVLAVNGVFHHFELAHELAKRGMLERIYSTFPWSRLKREGLDRAYLKTHYVLHLTQHGMQQVMRVPAGLNKQIDRRVRSGLDAYVARTLPTCDVYVALSGAGVLSGYKAQQRGALYICDRGSSHIRYQDQILAEEYARWGVPRIAVDPYFIDREEREYEQSDAITVPSGFAYRSFVEMGVPEEKLHRIPYGVRLERFQPSGEPSRDAFHVLFAGTVGLRKGVGDLLEAFQLLRHPNKKLRIVGPVLPETKSIFANHKMDGIEVIGRLPQQELARYMSTSHVMVLPSIEEGLALVQGQAMACGCPLISSYHTGGEDLFDEGVEGFLVPIRSPQIIADRLQKLADDPLLQQQMRAAALARVQHLGGWEHYGSLWEGLIKKLSS